MRRDQGDWPFLAAGKVKLRGLESKSRIPETNSGLLRKSQA
ncbi:hypothetical protein [Hyphomonas adhaerens]|nr:hypothetical protein [Hyphomonas adhaerens]